MPAVLKHSEKVSLLDIWIIDWLRCEQLPKYKLYLVGFAVEPTQWKLLPTLISKINFLFPDLLLQDPKSALLLRVERQKNLFIATVKQPLNLQKAAINSEVTESNEF